MFVIRQEACIYPSGPAMNPVGDPLLASPLSNCLWTLLARTQGKMKSEK